ncbi:Spherulin-4 OS=Physarum polycephalum PE=2 SV=1 [Rhizoctonia solani AG-1 IB]|uniref:Spherulin-4 n=1 Tax=Thanatephorus cucumeris (strain AG1-IB / isolate 7/3/14) TaxID=1108050 RepID=A0A0B7F2A3_THACB|nr:Spherulin-4 OS=Physarum polycephalum PE=2 SV=1 [Rhizoctonia solani AG-1 IB]
MLLARAALSSGIIFPLYFYPFENCSGWTDAISAAASHPNLPFYFIVNPNSGPGGLYTQPDANYQACVPKLRGSPNVKLIGYVRTEYGKIAQSTVQAEVDTYAQWNSAYKLDGIFFDEVLAQSSARTLYSGYTSYAKSKIPNAFVSLNPGTKPDDTNFYNFADQILSAEKYFSEFSSSTYTVGPSTPAAKQAIILTDSPSDIQDITSTVNKIIKTDRIGALYITDDVQANRQNPYDSFPTYWTDFVNAVQSAAS